MNTQLTPNEADVIAACMWNYYGMGDSYHNPTWQNCINDSNKPSNVTGRALSGVVSSLCKKGWLRASGSGPDATVSWASEEAYLKAHALTGKPI